MVLPPFVSIGYRKKPPKMIAITIMIAIIPMNVFLLEKMPEPGFNPKGLENMPS